MQCIAGQVVGGMLEGVLLHLIVPALHVPRLKTNTNTQMLHALSYAFARCQ